MFRKLSLAFSTPVLIGALPILVALSIWLLRQNNLTMVELRQTVIKVDTETGDINKVEPHLVALGNYVLGHMNTDLGGPVELPGSYNTAVERAREKAEASGTASGEVYKKAQQRCENPNIPLTARAQCIQEYVLSNAAPGVDAKELEFPDKTLYSYSFAAPRWSADWAGLVVLAACVVFVVLSWRIWGRVVWPSIVRWNERTNPLQ